MCWNNLGRNVVFANRRLRPQTVFGTTQFPGEDEPSQYDLDVHSILDWPDLGMVAVLNHIGAVRGFRRAEILGHSDGSLIEPASSWWFVADVERTVSAAGRLVGSAPRSGGAVGVLVSASLDTVVPGGEIPTRLCATAFGEVTALGVVPSPDGPLIGVGGEAKVALVPLVGDQLGRPRWEVDVGFRVATLAWHGDALWVAGPECGGAVDDYDWERLGGGGFAALAPDDGRTLVTGPLPGDVAWGTGGVAFAPFGRLVAAAGRTGCLHLVDPHGRRRPRSTAPLAGASLGMSHLAVVGGQVICGYNRGGYRLHAFAQSAANRDGP